MSSIHGGASVAKATGRIAPGLVVLALVLGACGSGGGTPPHPSLSIHRVGSPTKTVASTSTTGGVSVPGHISDGQIDPNKSDDAIVDVSCATVSFCGALSGSGGAYIFASGTWSGPQDLSTDGGAPVSISCAANGYCVAVGPQGGDTVYANGQWNPGPPMNSFEPQVVSCAGISLCEAIDNSSDIDIYSDGVWTPDGSVLSPGIGYGHDGHLTTLSCVPSTRVGRYPMFCAAVDSVGYLTMDLGNIPTVTPNPTDYSALVSVGCFGQGPSATCAAGSEDGHVLSDLSGDFVTTRIGDGSPLIGAACPALSTCVVANDDGQVFASEADSTTWTGVQSAQGSSGSYVSLSCPSATLCAEVDAAGQIQTFRP